MRLVLVATLALLAAGVSAPAAAANADAAALAGQLDQLLATGVGLDPDSLNRAFQGFYAQRGTPDWSTVTPKDLTDSLNPQGLPKTVALAAQFRVALPGLQITEDGAARALEYLKQGRYYDAVQAALASAGAGLGDLLRAAGQMHELALVSYAFTTASPVAPGVQVMHHLLRQVVLARAVPTEPRTVGVAQVSRVGLFGLNTSVGAEGYYATADTKGLGESLDSYGMNLHGTMGDRWQVRASVPLSHASLHGLEQYSYGADLSLKYSFSEWFAVGAHGNYLGFEGDWTHEANVAGGPFLGYSYRLSQTYLVSVGALVDYLAPGQGKETWVGGFAANLGMNLLHDITLNGYYIYFRNFDAPAFADQDWHDLGADLAISFGAGGLLTLGGKTTLGYGLFDSNWQIYAGLSWRF